MNLPMCIDDPSLLQHEPLCSYIAMYEGSFTDGVRSESKLVVSSFVREMQENSQAALKVKAWACMVFSDSLSEGSSFEFTDNGEELFKVFFEYQYRLSRRLKPGCANAAHEYIISVYKRGIGAIRLKVVSRNTHRPTQGEGSKRCKDQGNQRSSRPLGRGTPGPKKGRRQTKTGNQPPHEGDGTINPNLECVSRSTMGNTAKQQEHSFDTSPDTGAQMSTVSEAAKSSKRSASRKGKKRKPSSQKPPVITPSDASEDDKESSKIHAVTTASSISNRSALKLSRQSRGLLRAKKQVVKKSSAHGFKTRHFRALLRFRRKRGDETFSNISHKRSRGGLNSKRLRKIKSVSALPTRANKRPRLSSTSTPDGDLRAEFLQNPRIPGPLVTRPPPTRKSLHMKAKARGKRTRLEFEMGPIVSHANTSCCDILGPDIRALRPLPRKVRSERLMLGEDTAIRGVPCGTPSIEQIDQLLRDVASNALAILQEGAGPDVGDWTQNKEQDIESDDFDGCDEGKVHDVQVTAATSLPSVVTAKPPLPTPPRIWAQSRQEVCESFDHFRSYHSGVYSKDDIVKGYLLGAYAASRDKFHHGGKLIISHGGGKSESILDCRRGPKRYQTDQDQEASDKSVRALLKTYKDRRPLVLLADDKYALFPYDLTSGNHTYVVLGSYWISHAWAECQPARDGSGRIVRWKFAFQWCEGQGDPWWPSQQEMTDAASKPPASVSDTCPPGGSSHPANTDGDSTVECESCQQRSPFIYKQGWICLNPLCNVFWTINGEEPEQLDYREEFLTLLPQRFDRFPNLTPTRVTETSGGVTTTFAFSKGWHCMKCGRLSCRYKWEHWECSNCGCKHVVNGRVRSPKEFWHQRPHKEFLHSRVGKDSGIVACRLEPINLGAHKGFTNRLTFILPYDRSKIHLILGTPLSNGDADSIFQLYQQQASIGELKLRRYPLRNHRARGQLLTNYFSQNSGEPYQYVGGTGNTVPFHEAPDCVRRALALIKERSSLALHTNIPFNEILSAAYMERQKMSFHSDSEKGLGPVVASLSLGSAALMHFRPHVTADSPKSKNAHALTLALRHGDVLIMEGDGVQKYYEHTVIPMNFRIAATARCIGST